MRAIPLDVIRAFVAVVDSRGFTRAAEDLGRSQPAISLQVKRLEELIEAPLFEKSSRLNLTPEGKICLDYGRKLLALHDEMLERLERRDGVSEALRVGMPGECASLLVPSLGAMTGPDGRGFNFDFACEMSEALLERVQSGGLDVALAITAQGGAKGALAQWRVPVAWIASPEFRLPLRGPIPLVTTPEDSVYHRLATAALYRAGRKFEIVCKSANFDVLKSAIDAGFGVGAIVSSCAPRSARLLPSSQIAALPDVMLGLYGGADAGSRPVRALIEYLIGLIGAERLAASA